MPTISRLDPSNPSVRPSSQGPRSRDSATSTASHAAASSPEAPPARPRLSAEDVTFVRRAALEPSFTAPERGPVHPGLLAAPLAPTTLARDHAGRSARDAARGAIGVFDGFASGARAPSDRGVGVALDEAEHTTTTSSLGDGSLAVGANRYASEADVARSYAAELTRKGLYIGGNVTTRDGQKVGLSSFLANGYLSLGVNGAIDLEDRLAWADPNGATLYTGGYLAGWSNYLGVGASAGLATSEGTLQIGGYVSLSADRVVRYLGPQGAPATERGATETPPAHGLEIREQRDLSARLQGGAAQGALGIGGRLQVSRKEEMVYRTQVSQTTAQQALEAAADPRNFLQHKAEALGWAARAIPFPRLSHPEEMKVGDEVVTEVTGSVQGGVVLGGLGPSIGVSGTMQGSFRLSTRKIDEDHIELVVSPTKMKSVGITAGLPLAGAQMSRSIGIALSQAFVFDLRSEDAAAAYRKALHGVLPSNLRTPSAVRENDDGRLLAAMQKEDLPRGVTRTYLEKAEVPMTVKGLATGLLFLPDSAGVDGLSYHQICSTSQQVVTDGQIALSRDTASKEDRWALLWSGQESQAVSATVRRVTRSAGVGSYQRDFDRLILRSTLHDTKVVGDDNTDIVEKLNKAFGTTVDAYRRDGHKQTREVKLERALGRDDFERLATATVSEIRRAAALSGARVEPLTNLIASLCDEYNPWDRAKLVQAYVAEQELSGFGALHQILGAPKRLLVKTSSDAYDAPMQAAKELALEYGGPIEGWMSSRRINDRFRSVQDALDKTKVGLRDLEDDQIMKDLDPNAVDAVRQQLVTTRKLLRSMISLDHMSRIERQKVYEKLSLKTVEQRAELLSWKYDAPIHHTESKATIKQRFHEILGVRREIRRELSKLGSDRALRSADLRTQVERQEALLEAERRLEGCLRFDHLTPEQRGDIYLRVEKKRSSCFPSRRSHESLRILGMLDALGVRFSEHRPFLASA